MEEQKLIQDLEEKRAVLFSEIHRISIIDPDTANRITNCMLNYLESYSSYLINRK